MNGGNHELLKLFKGLEETFSQELLERAVVRVIPMLTFQGQGFEPLIAAGLSHSKAWERVLKGAYARKGQEVLPALLQLYLDGEKKDWVLKSALLDIRSKAFKGSDWDTLRLFAEKGLTGEFEIVEPLPGRRGRY